MATGNVPESASFLRNWIIRVSYRLGAVYTIRRKLVSFPLLLVLCDGVRESRDPETEYGGR